MRVSEWRCRVNGTCASSTVKDALISSSEPGSVGYTIRVDAKVTQWSSPMPSTHLIWEPSSTVNEAVPASYS